MAAKIKKGDTVLVVSGKDRGTRGKVLEVFPGEDRVIVEGVNIQKRHVKPGSKQSMPQGGILERPGKIHVSNVKFWSESLGSGVRVGFQVDEEGRKVRVARGTDHAETPLD
ncbi:MAG: 50S ribosomal protein L24 [Myxococcota bacterium]